MIVSKFIGKIGVAVLLLRLLSLDLVAQVDTLSIFIVEADKPFVSKPYQTIGIDSLQRIEYAALNLSQLLQRESNLFVKDYGPGQLASISYRGTTAAQNQIYWDGLPINSPMLGQLDLSTISGFLFQEASLHLGASSIVDGSGGLGGSIRLNNGFGADTSFKAAVTYGSFNQLWVGGSGNILLEKWKLRAAITRQTSQNDFEYHQLGSTENPVQKRSNSAFEQFQINGGIQRDLKGQQSISANFWLNETNREIPPIEVTPQDSLSSQKDFSIRSMLRYTLTKSKWQLAARSGFFHERLLFSNPLTIGDSPSSWNSWIQQVSGKYFIKNNWLLQAKVDYHFHSAEIENYEGIRTQSRQSVLINSVYTLKEALTLDGSIRTEQIDNLKPQLMPSVGFAYQPVPSVDFTIKGNASRIYRFPTLNDRFWVPGGNADLLPESGTAWEGGITYEAKVSKLNSRLAISTNYFENLIDNWIQWAPTANGIFGAQNLTKVQTRGIETSAGWNQKIGKVKLDLNGVYSYTLANDLSLVESSQLIYTPKHQAQGRINLAYKTFGLDYQYSFSGRREVTSDNSVYLPSFWQANVGLTKRFNKWNQLFSIRVAAQNIFDISYQVVAWRPMPGRNYQIMIYAEL